MAKENPGFEVIGGTESNQPTQPDPNAVALALITLGIKTLSQRALTAATDLFTLITCAGAFYLWMVTPNPDDKQIISLSIYALFTLAANFIVRRK
jgi:hypothetical protein